MKPGLLKFAALSCCLALAMLAGACAKVQQPLTPPPGPPVKAGLSAVMPSVKDDRIWPPIASEAVDLNIRVFAPQITERMRAGLLASKQFAALPAPDSPAARALDSRLTVTIRFFGISAMGSNAWLVPHLLVDGVILPVFAVGNVATGGRLDVGGYLLPSTKLGTTINATVDLLETGLSEPVLSQSYLVEVDLGSVSQRQILASLQSYQGYAVGVGKSEGQKAIDELVRHISRDPRWAYVPDYRNLVAARLALKAATPPPAAAPTAQPAAGYAVQSASAGRARSPWQPPSVGSGSAGPVPAGKGVAVPAGQAAAAEAAKPVDPAEAQAAATRAVTACLPLLRPMTYSPEEAKILRDGALNADTRALLANEVRARYQGLADSKKLPAKYRVSEDEAFKLFDAPAVETDVVRGELATEAVKLVVRYLSAPWPTPAQKAALSREVVKRMQGQLQLQTVLLTQADDAVNNGWPPMLALLQQLDSVQVKNYLESREEL